MAGQELQRELASQTPVAQVDTHASVAAAGGQGDEQVESGEHGQGQSNYLPGGQVQLGAVLFDLRGEPRWQVGALPVGGKERHACLHRDVRPLARRR